MPDANRVLAPRALHMSREPELTWSANIVRQLREAQPNQIWSRSGGEQGVRVAEGYPVCREWNTIRTMALVLQVVDTTPSNIENPPRSRHDKKKVKVTE